MRPIVNLPEEDRATTIGKIINQILFILQPCGWIKWPCHTSRPIHSRCTTFKMHKNLVKIARGVPEISCRTNRQTDALIAIFRNRSRERGNKQREISASRRLRMRPTLGKSLRSLLRYQNSGIPSSFLLNVALKSTDSITEKCCWCRNCCQWSAALPHILSILWH